MMNTSPGVTVNVHKAELFSPGWQSFSLSFTSLQLFGVYSKVLKNLFFVTSDILVFIFHYSGLRSFAFFLLLFTDYLFL